MLMLPVTSIGTSPSMAPSIVLTSTRRTRHASIRTQGATSNYKNLPDSECEPAGHGIGRSRGGLTTKIHHAVDGKGRPLAVVVTGGQRHDGVILPQVLADIRVPRVGGGRPRTCPDAVLADRAYGSRANRDYLRSRGIRAVIPEKKDQIATRKKRGSKGGRPPAFDAGVYRNRNVVERSFA
ncbi:transposase for insertion sequence element [Corynebacterium variabile DSM 44702]|nr:transposase for insertion sequence element [Corynebacterium variabile DSM 44702]